MASNAVTPSVGQALRNLISVITRDQGPEFEQTLTYTTLSQISTPTSLRTDRKIKTILLQLKGRITVGANPVAFQSGPPILATPLFRFFQQVKVRGQHLRYGSQVPIDMRGETIAEMEALWKPAYNPYFAVGVNGATPVPYASLSGAANATNDFIIELPITTFPLACSMQDAAFYCIHGPDWPGNLFVDIITADATALGVTNASVTLSAFQATSGSMSVDIHTERPLLGKDVMAQLRPGILLRTTNYTQPAQAVQTGSGGNNQKLADLLLGKDTPRIFIKVGKQLASTSAGVIAYDSTTGLLDNVLTRTFFSMDNRNLRFQNANGDSTLHKDYLARTLGRNIPAGYRVFDFTMTPGAVYGGANPKASFSSSQLTAARIFQANADISNVAATNLAELVQEQILGAPAILKGGE